MVVLGFNWNLEHSWQNSCLVLGKISLVDKDKVVGEISYGKAGPSL